MLSVIADGGMIISKTIKDKQALARQMLALPRLHQGGVSRRSRDLSQIMKFVAHVIDGHHVDIRPAPVERDWMEATSQRFAYRCLPLNIANAYGWEVLCNAGFLAMWTGRQYRCDRDRAEPGTIAAGRQPFRPWHPHLPSALPVPHRARRGTDGAGADQPAEGRDRGALRHHRDRLVALQLHHELDVHPAGTPVRFEKGEPYCHIFPVRCGALEGMEPELGVLSDEPELKRQHDAWTASRASFNTDLKQPGSDAQSEKWQKRYYRGLSPDGAPTAAEAHRTRFRQKPFKTETR